MHLAIYSEWTKRRPTDRIAVCAITARGEPKRRQWEDALDWNTGKGTQVGDANLRQPRLLDLIERLQWWEEHMRDMEIISTQAHLLVFCSFQLKVPVKAAFGKMALYGWEFSEHSVHFPTRLTDDYGLPYV